MVVLGGGLMNLPDFFYQDASRICYELAGTMMLKHMAIKRGTLGARAGILGASALFQP